MTLVYLQKTWEKKFDSQFFLYFLTFILRFGRFYKIISIIILKF